MKIGDMHNIKLFNRALIAVALLLLVVFGSWAAGAWQNQHLHKKPKLGLITTLPLRWGEGDLADMVSPTSMPSAAYKSLEADYQITMIDAVDAKSLNGNHVLMMAQPRAFAPAELVAIDSWIRNGGHALILADPALTWESSYPLGDKRRPLFTSLMSPLFAHWGIDLVLPMEVGNEKIVVREISGQTVQTSTPGAWQPRAGPKSAQCSISDNGMIAQCIAGKGRAIMIADADLLKEDFWQGSGLRVISRADDFGNMTLIKKYLSQITMQGK